ncbi:hypothetical protein ACET3X_005552 [Alternaria dauci]|uniref:Cep57 centrosome microtubule-binding domain-containing protein n=1 Tax=Alternaria dauci TaxID=48095 RepID=A0ABR3UL63_9PLEO
MPGVEDPKQLHLTTSRRKSSNLPASPPPQSSSESQPFPAGRKTPAYLQGRNPYGQVLDKVEHPYREPKGVTTTAVPPAQAGSGIETASRASGPSDSKPQSRAQEPERRDPKTAPSSSRPQIPKSVRSAKEYFEARASQYQSTSLVPPPATGASRKSFAPKIQPPNVFHEAPTHVPSPKVPSTPEVASPEVGLLLPSLMDFGDTNESVQSVIPPTRAAADEHAPTITVGRATSPMDMPENGEQYGQDVEREPIGRRRSTNNFVGTPQDVKPFGINLQAASDSSAQAPIPEEPLVGNGDQSLVDKPEPAAEAVRDLSTHSSVPAAETRAAEPPNTQSQQEGRRAKSGRNLRRTFEEDQGAFPKRLRRSGSQTASLTETGSSSKESIDRVAEWSSSTDAKTSLYQSGKSINVRRRAAEISSRNLGHDGASDFSFSRRSTVSSPVPTANIGVEEKYHEIEVPDDVDNRQGYGRRVTQDFGFPGARIKSHGTNRTSRPLQDPEKLNVGSTGQLKPNLNDPRHSLRDALQSIPDLVDLVNSAADDLGVDLERKPTATDDDMFRNAPYESAPRESGSCHPDVSIEAIEDKATDKEPVTEDNWLQETRRHLSELSEARKQLMDELDSIAGDFEVQLQDQQETELGDESIVNPVQRVLNKASTRLSHMSTLHTDALVESVHCMLDSASTSPSRRLTLRDEDMVDDLVVEPVQRVLSKTPLGASPEEIEEVLRVARDELPAAVASVTAVLQTLPGTEYEPANEGEIVYQAQKPKHSSAYSAPILDSDVQSHLPSPNS